MIQKVKCIFVLWLDLIGLKNKLFRAYKFDIKIKYWIQVLIIYIYTYV